MPLGTEDHVCNGQIVREMVFDVDRVPSGTNDQRCNGAEVKTETEALVAGEEESVGDAAQKV